MPKNAAYFDVTYKALADLLRLPEGAEICRVVSSDDGTLYSTGVIRVVVEHPDLPEVHEGDQLQRVDPSLRRTEDGTLEFATWGLPK